MWAKIILMKQMASIIEIYVGGKTHTTVKQWKEILVCDSASATKRYRIMDETKSEFDGWYRVTWRGSTVFVSIEIGRDTRGLWKEREGGEIRVPETIFQIPLISRLYPRHFVPFTRSTERSQFRSLKATINSKSFRVIFFLPRVYTHVAY